MGWPFYIAIKVFHFRSLARRGVTYPDCDMAMENLTITQHWSILWYATIHGGGYWFKVQGFELRDYVYLQEITPTTLDVTIGCVILDVWFFKKLMGFFISRLGWSNMEKLCVELCTMSPSTCEWQSGSISGHNPTIFAKHVMWKITRCNNHVALWPFFKMMMAYGLFYTTTCGSSNRRLGVSMMHQMYLFCVRPQY
jgi:hypothetical protein